MCACRVIFSLCSCCFHEAVIAITKRKTAITECTWELSLARTGAEGFTPSLKLMQVFKAQLLGGDHMEWYQSTLTLACRMSQAVAGQYMVYVVHSLILYCGPTRKGSWNCFLPLGCYCSQWVRELKRKEKKKDRSWQCSDPFKNQLPKVLFDHNFVCFICFWRLSDVTNPYSTACIQIQFCDEKLCSPPVWEDLWLLICSIIHLCMELSDLILCWLSLMYIRSLAKDMRL